MSGNMKVTLDGGKYTWVSEYSSGKQYALRHGEEWSDLVGDNLTLAMGTRIFELEEALTAVVADLEEGNTSLYDLSAVGFLRSTLLGE